MDAVLLIALVTLSLLLLGFVGIQRLRRAEVEIQALKVELHRLGQQSSGSKETASLLRDLIASTTQKTDEIENRISDMLMRHKWLDLPDAREIADDTSSIRSVEQAHNIALRFREVGDRGAARHALQQIIEKDLLGSFDDFHNAHIEALRMDEAVLGLQIVDKGLKHFPDQYDLMADKANALTSLGRHTEARELLEEWRARKPGEFARGWRPIVFYYNAVVAGELTPENIERIEQAFIEVTKQNPIQTKPWSSYARFERDLGRLERAEEILREGLKHNPLSQELNYILGEILLQQGQGKESLEFLENALKVDFQEQYQHDVAQDAVKTTLAEAYEAVGDLAKAELLYRAVLESPDARGHISSYAKNRLSAIAIQRGEIAKESEVDTEKAMQTLLGLVQASRKTE